MHQSDVHLYHSLLDRFLCGYGSSLHSSYICVTVIRIPPCLCLQKFTCDYLYVSVLLYEVAYEVVFFHVLCFLNKFPFKNINRCFLRKKLKLYFPELCFWYYEIQDCVFWDYDQHLYHLPESVPWNQPELDLLHPPLGNHDRAHQPIVFPLPPIIHPPTPP